MTKPSLPLTALAVLLLAAVSVIWLLQSSANSDQSSQDQLAQNEGEAPELHASQESQAGVIDRNTADSPGASTSFADEYSRSTVRVQVLDPDGVGVEDVRLIPWVGIEIGEEQVTNASGMAEFEFLNGFGGIAFASAHRFIEWQPMVLGQELIIHQFQRGQVLAGQLSFSDEASRREFTVLEAAFDDYPFYSQVPESVESRLNDLGWFEWECDLLIEEDGSFRLEGLPADWIGNISTKGGFLISSFRGSAEMVWYKSLFLPGPAQDLEIEVSIAPTFRGRLVAANPGLKVEDRSAYLRVIWADGSVFYSEGCWVDEQGYFEDTIWPQDDQEYRAWQNDLPHLAPARVEVFSYKQRFAIGDSIPQRRADSAIWDLGEISVHDFETVQITVQNQQGEPLRSAYAAAQDERGKTFGPSDARGIIHLSPDDRNQALSVGAPGYETMLLAVPEDGIEGGVVTLEAVTDLTLFWQFPAHVDMSGLYVEILNLDDQVILKKSLFEEVEARLRETGGFDWWAARKGFAEGRTNGQWGFDAQQRELRIWGLEPEIELEIQMLDALDMPIAQKEILILEPGERRRHELQVLVLPRALIGQVVNQKGQPLTEGEYYFGTDAENGSHSSLDESGFFMREAVGTPTVWVEVTVPGYGMYVNESLEIPKDGSPVKIVMKPGRDLQVTYQDIHGNFYSDGFCWSGAMAGIYSEDQPSRAASLLADAPQGRFLLEWHLGGLSGSQWVEPAVTEVTVLVPAMGGLSLNLSRLDTVEGEYWDLALKPAANNSFAAKDYYYTNSEEFLPRQTWRSHRILDTPAGFYFIELSRRPIEEYGGVKSDESGESEEQLPEQPPHRIGPIEVISGQMNAVDLEF